MHLLLLRSLFREMVSDLAGPAPTADEPNRGGMTRYLIVVARTEPAVYEHLRNRHLGDAKVRVMLDRRGALEYDSSDNTPPVDRLDVTHLAWCLLVGSAGLRVRRRGLGGYLGRERDQLV